MAKNERCPMCAKIGGHTAQCNLGSKVSASEIKDLDQRSRDKKKKFENKRVYRSAIKKD